MDKEERAKLAVLWDDRDDMKAAFESVRQMELTLAELPQKMNEAIEEKCITRKEFKTVNAVIVFLVFIVGSFGKMKDFILGKL